MTTAFTAVTDFLHELKNVQVALFQNIFLSEKNRDSCGWIRNILFG